MLDWIFEGIITWVSSVVTDLMDAVSGMFLQALGTDMTAMEEYFPFVSKAFTVMQYTAWALLFLITVWQLFRVFGGPVTDAENPWALIGRSALFALLEEYGFLQAQKDKYIINFIISEPTAELLTMQNDMYKRAAELFANDLYDELTSSGILDDPDILCGQTDAPISLTESPKADRNFILWTLIPYIAAWSGEKLMDESISFEEVATIRPDGAHNIYHASVVPDEMVLPDDYVYMRNWCGPMWNKGDYQMMWQIDSEWSDRAPVKERNIPEEQERTITLLNWEKHNLLSKHDYAWLAERGYIKTNGDYDGHFKSAWQIVVLASNEIRDKLLAIGERIKVKYQTEFDALKAPYAEAVLESVPAHLRKIKAYELQFVFHADGWFLVHCITALLKNGKLKEPTEGQRKSLTTLIANV